MTLTDARTDTSGLLVAGDVELWFERRGEGPDVLLIGGLSDPAEAWAPQLEGLALRLSSARRHGSLGPLTLKASDGAWPPTRRDSD